MTLIKDVNRDFKDIIRSGIRVASLSEKNYSGVCLEYDTVNISEVSRNIIFLVNYKYNYFDVVKLLTNK